MFLKICLKWLILLLLAIFSNAMAAGNELEYSDSLSNTYGRLLGMPWYLRSVTFDRRAPTMKALGAEVQLIHLYDTLWSEMVDMMVDGSMAFCAMNAGLKIVDISDPTEPSDFSNVSLPLGESRDIAVDPERSLAYIASWGSEEAGALYIIDISNASDPFIIGSCEIPRSAYGVAYSGDNVIVAYGHYQYDMGLYMLDVSDPAKPLEIAEVPMGWVPLKLTIDDTLTYVLCETSLYVFNVFTEPVDTVAVFPIPAINSIPCMGVDLHLLGDRLFIAAPMAWDPTYSSRALVLDISDPENMSVIKNYLLPGIVSGGFLNGDTLYVANTGYGLKVFDLNSPDDIPISTYYSAGSVGKVVMANNYAIIADYGPSDDWKLQAESMTTVLPRPGDLQVVNFSQPQSPVLTGLLQIAARVTRSYRYGDHAFVLNDGSYGPSIRTINVASVDEPFGLSEYFVGGSAQRIARVNDSVFALAAGSSGVQLLNYVDPVEPQFISSMPGGSGSLDIALYGNFAYLANSSSGICEYDITDLDNPAPVDCFSTAGIASSMVLYNQYAYVSVISLPYSWVLVYDISDPANIVMVNDLEINCIDLTLWGDYLIARLANGFRIYNLTDPMSPSLVGEYFAGTDVRSVATAGAYMFLACGSRGLSVISLADVANPAFVGDYDLPGFTVHVYADAQRLYVSNTSSWCIIDHSSLTDVDDGSEALPFKYRLEQNYPNPFNPTTTIEYELPRGQFVRLTVYNMLGQIVVVLVDEYQSAGTHTVQWDGRSGLGNPVSSGIYPYRLDTNLTKQSKKMVLLK